MKMWANITCTKMKKSSNAQENPNMNDTNPIHIAKIAQPENKFLKFLMFVLS